MQKYKYTGTGNSGTFAWIIQRVSGIAIAISATIIFCQLVFSESHAITSWLLFPALAFGLWHTFSGFKMITDDYVSCEILRLVLLFLYWAIGITLFALGLPFVLI